MSRAKSRKRAAGSLTHEDFGKFVKIDGYPEGILWGVHHVAVLDGSAEPYTRILFQGLTDECTKGLPPETPVTVREVSARDLLGIAPDYTDGMSSVDWVRQQRGRS